MDGWCALQRKTANRSNATNKQTHYKVSSPSVQALIAPQRCAERCTGLPAIPTYFAAPLQLLQSPQPPHCRGMIGANKTAMLSLAARLPSKQLITVNGSKQNSNAKFSCAVAFEAVDHGRPKEEPPAAGRDRVRVSVQRYTHEVEAIGCALAQPRTCAAKPASATVRTV
jgi:hypothetical protein